jgi:hypothetical protein
VPGAACLAERARSARGAIGGLRSSLEEQRHDARVAIRRGHHQGGRALRVEWIVGIDRHAAAERLAHPLLVSVARRDLQVFGVDPHRQRAIAAAALDEHLELGQREERGIVERGASVHIAHIRIRTGVEENDRNLRVSARRGDEQRRAPIGTQSVTGRSDLEQSADDLGQIERRGEVQRCVAVLSPCLEIGARRDESPENRYRSVVGPASQTTLNRGHHRGVASGRPRPRVGPAIEQEIDDLDRCELGGRHERRIAVTKICVRRRAAIEGGTHGGGVASLDRPDEGQVEAREGRRGSSVGDEQAEGGEEGAGPPDTQALPAHDEKSVHPVRSMSAQKILLRSAAHRSVGSEAQTMTALHPQQPRSSLI